MDDRRPPELGEAARRGLRRAGVHLMKAAIEVVAGVEALIDEIQQARRPDGEEPADAGRRRIELDE